jgi:hypothetical protein
MDCAGCFLGLIPIVNYRFGQLFLKIFGHLNPLLRMMRLDLQYQSSDHLAVCPIPALTPPPQFGADFDQLNTQLILHLDNQANGRVHRYDVATSF